VSDRIERAAAKGLLAAELSAVGAGIGSVGGPAGAAVGAGVGAITGLIVGDREIVFPIDMIAIPAFQAYMLQGTPSFQIFIKEGEVLNQVQLTDAQEAEATVESIVGRDTMSMKKKRKKGAGLPKKYAKMGFKKGWAAYKKTPAYKKKQAAKKRSSKNKSTRTRGKK